MRKGLTVKTLKDFMMAQGPSKNANCQEWDKLWAMNRNNIDPIAKRLFAISDENKVKVILDNVNDEVQKVDVDWHQKVKTHFYIYFIFTFIKLINL
jgi:glutamyl/glutaminyl-tRNA synthetase